MHVHVCSYSKQIIPLAVVGVPQASTYCDLRVLSKEKFVEVSQVYPELRRLIMKGVVLVPFRVPPVCSTNS